MAVENYTPNNGIKIVHLAEGLLQAARNKTFEFAFAAQYFGLAAYYALGEGRPLERALFHPFTATQRVNLFATAYDNPIGIAAALVQSAMTVEVPLVIIARGLQYIQSLQAAQRGEVPNVLNSRSVLIADYQGLPIVEKLGKVLLPDQAGTPKNVNLLISTSSPIKNPDGRLFGNWYLNTKDPEATAFETDVLVKGGALDAGTVVLNYGSDEAAYQTALTIHTERAQRGLTPSRIIPVRFGATDSDAFYYEDIDNLRVRISEPFIDPAQIFASKLADALNGNLDALHFFAKSAPTSMKARKEGILERKVIDLPDQNIRVFINSDKTGIKAKALEGALKGTINLDGSNKFLPVEEPDSADIIISCGSGDLKELLSVAKYAREIWQAAGDKYEDKLRLAVTFSQDTEDNLLLLAEGATSFQRLAVEAIAQAISNSVEMHYNPMEVLRRIFRF